MNIFNEAQTCGAITNASLKAELTPTPKGVGVKAQTRQISDIGLFNFSDV